MLIDTSIIFGARLVFLLASHRLLVTLDPTLAHLSTDGDDDTLVSRPATPDVEGGPMEERGDAVVVQNTKQGLSTASRYVWQTVWLLIAHQTLVCSVHRRVLHVTFHCSGSRDWTIWRCRRALQFFGLSTHRVGLGFGGSSVETVSAVYLWAK